MTCLLVIKSTARLFADDCLLYRRIHTASDSFRLSNTTLQTYRHGRVHGRWHSIRRNERSYRLQTSVNLFNLFTRYMTSVSAILEPIYHPLKLYMMFNIVKHIVEMTLSGNFWRGLYIYNSYTVTQQDILKQSNGSMYLLVLIKH